MAVTNGTLVIGTEIFTNQTSNPNIGIYRVSQVQFFAVHGSPPTASTNVDIVIDIIDGDTSEILAGQTFNRLIADGQTVSTINEIQINFTRPDGTLPNSIIVNWEASPFDNVRNTIQFTGDIDNFDIVLTAKNGRELKGTSTRIDKDFIQVQLGLFGAGMVFSPSTSTANLTAQDMLFFITSEQGSNLTTVTSEKGTMFIRRISDDELKTVITGLPAFSATQTNELHLSAPNGTAEQLLTFAQNNQITQQTQSMDSLVTAENGATQTVVVTVEVFNTLQGSLLQWGAIITGFLVERNPTHSIGQVESFAKLNQDIPPPPDIIPVGVTTVTLLNTSYKPMTLEEGLRVKGAVNIDLVNGGFTDTINLRSWITQIGDSEKIRGQNLSFPIIPSDTGLFRFDGVRLVLAPFNVDGLELHTEATSGTTGQIIGTDSVVVPWQGTIPPKGCDEFTDNVRLQIGFGTDAHLVTATITADEYCDIIRPLIIPPVFLSKAFNTLDVVTKTVSQVVSEIEAHLLEHQPNTGIEDTSVSIFPSDFELIEGRLRGQIKYIANMNFNPLYFGSEFHVGALVKYTEENGDNHFVEQTLNFTETERDENQTINENAFGNRVLLVEIFVVSALNVPFAKNVGLSVSEGIPPCPVGFHQENGVCVKDKVEAGQLIKVVKGVFFGGLALALLASRGR